MRSVSPIALLVTVISLTAGTVLNSELTYGLFFLGYVVTVSWALMLFHLRREVEERFVVPGEARLGRLLESRRLIDRLFGGKLTPLVAHLAERDQLTAQDIAEIEAILKDLKQ